MNNEGSTSVIFFGVIAVLIFLVIGGLTTKINRDSGRQDSQISRLYSKLASLEKKPSENCTTISADVICLTIGNLIVFQQPSKIGVYDAVSKANIANFIRKDSEIHYTASQETLKMLTLEFLEN